MRRSRFTRVAAASLILALAITLSAPRAHADWDDRSGSLPGIGGIRSAILLGAAIGGGLVLYAVLRGGGRSDVRASPARLDLREGSPEGDVSLRNSGKRPITVIGLDLAGGESFQLREPSVSLPATLAPDETLMIRIRFTARSAGQFADELTVTTQEGESRKTRHLRVRLRGTVAEVPLENAAFGRP